MTEDQNASFSQKRLPPSGWRAGFVDDVRRRLEEGELDTDAALLETAHALLDGDAPVGR